MEHVVMKNLHTFATVILDILGQTVRQILTNVMVRTAVVMDCVWMESTRMLVYAMLGILVIIAARTLTIVSFKIAVEMVNVWMK